MRWGKLSVALIIWPFTILNDAAFPLFLCKCNMLATDPLDAGVDCVGWMRLPHLTGVWMDLKERWEESTWENVYSFVERQLKASIREGYLCTFIVSFVHHCSMWAICECVHVCPQILGVLWVWICVYACTVCVYVMLLCVYVLNAVSFDDFLENN